MLYTQDQEPIYEYQDMTQGLLNEIMVYLMDKKTIFSKNNYYIGDFMTMDIETSTINRGTENAIAFTYSIAVYIAGRCLLFRRWEDYTEFMSRLTGTPGLSYKTRLACYMHNLPYEFQFMKDFMHIQIPLKQDWGMIRWIL